MLHIYVLRKMQVKTRDHCTPKEMAKVWTTDTTKCQRGCEATGTLIHRGGNAKWYTFWKTIWTFLIKLNIFLPCDPATTLLGIYTKELKIYVHIQT